MAQERLSSRALENDLQHPLQPNVGQYLCWVKITRAAKVWGFIEPVVLAGLAVFPLGGGKGTQAQSPMHFETCLRSGFPNEKADKPHLEKIIMRKTLATVLAAIGLTLSLATHAETWSCGYQGNWSTYSVKEEGSFKWTVVWQSKPAGGWTVAGEFSDQYGPSRLSGNCTDTSCSLVQTYKSGELKDKVYYWKGQYSEQPVSNTQVTNRFKGTWGTTPAAKDGAWQAVATCTLG